MFIRYKFGAPGRCWGYKDESNGVPAPRGTQPNEGDRIALQYDKLHYRVINKAP